MSTTTNTSNQRQSRRRPSRTPAQRGTMRYTDTEVVTFSVTPGVQAFIGHNGLPGLTSLATRFNEHRFLGNVTVEFVSTCSAQVSGVYVMGVDADGKTPRTDFQTVSRCQPQLMGSVTRAGRLTIPGSILTRNRFVVDAEEAEMPVLLLATQGVTEGIESVGLLRITYDVEFRSPRLETSLSLPTQFGQALLAGARYPMNNVSSTTPLGVLTSYTATGVAPRSEFTPTNLNDPYFLYFSYYLDGELDVDARSWWSDIVCSVSHVSWFSPLYNAAGKLIGLTLVSIALGKWQAQITVTTATRAVVQPIAACIALTEASQSFLDAIVAGGQWREAPPTTFSPLQQ